MDVKQVIVMRKDLKMRRGKEIAQGAHASSAWAMHTIKALLTDSPKPMCISDQEVEWMNGLHTKITVYVNSEQELMDIYNKAMLGPDHPPCYLITDAGLTEFNGVPTKTCLAIGPDESDKIDLITKHLPLY